MQSGNEIWSVYSILQNNFFYQKIPQKMWSRNWFQAFFNFQRILCKKDSVKSLHADLDKF